MEYFQDIQELLCKTQSDLRNLLINNALARVIPEQVDDEMSMVGSM